MCGYGNKEVYVQLIRSNKRIFWRAAKQSPMNMRIPEK